MPKDPIEYGPEDLRFAWCDMCGFNAELGPKMAAKLDAEPFTECPDCKANEGQSYLNAGPELPEHIAEDEPMTKLP